MARPNDGLVRRHAIFGVPVEVRVPDCRAGRVLLDELAIYPTTDAAPGLTALVRRGPPPHEGLNNPAEHWDLGDGFVARYGRDAVRYRFDGGRITAIELFVGRRARIAKARRRVRDPQYSSADEVVAQKFHERGLMAAAYSDPSLFLVHASGFALSEGAAVLIGGTGGSGKTALGIELCFRRGAVFLTDDHAVVDDTGLVHPNLAYPKIYAYNTVDDPALAQRLLAGRGVFDRAQWAWKNLRGGNAIRRRVSPADLYGRIAGAPARLGRYVILSREVGATPTVTPISADDAFELTLAVMQTEHAAIHRHCRWHAFNRRIEGGEPLLDLDLVFARWRSQACRVFGQAECLLVRMPREMPHAAFRDRVAEIALAGGEGG